MSVYRTIGPLFFFWPKKDNYKGWTELEIPPDWTMHCIVSFP